MKKSGAPRFRKLTMAAGLAVALTATLLTGATGPAVAADGLGPADIGDIGITNTCADTRSTTQTGTIRASNRLSGVTSSVRSGSIAGGTYWWGRVTGTSSSLSPIKWVIFEVDRTNNNQANCYVRRSVGSSAVNTVALQKGSSNWRFRTCWSVLTNPTSCDGLNSRTAWVG